MKRRYKPGDWFAVPLGASYDAIGIITRACRSRLFGYFFAVPAGHVPSHEELRSLRAADAATCALFGGAPLEDARWPMLATSLRFDPAAWPFPQFGSRGAFARTWCVRTYDPDTLQTVRTQVSDETRAAALPDARFATASDLEALLLERICGEPPSQPGVVCEIRSPIDPRALEPLAHGGRVQFGEPLAQRDLRVLAELLAAHPEVELRVHGFFGEPFDARSLREFARLRSLTLDVARIGNAGELRALAHLRSLRIGPLQAPLPANALDGLPQLRRIELRGVNAPLDALRSLAGLESLALHDVRPFALRELACARVLRELILAYAAVPLDELRELPSLARLEVRGVSLRALPDLSRNGALASVALRGVRLLRDLQPLACAPALRELRLEGMPQLEVADIAPIAGAAALRTIVIDAGSRSKEREMYRLLRGRSGRSAPGKPGT